MARLLTPTRSLSLLVALGGASIVGCTASDTRTDVDGGGGGIDGGPTIDGGGPGVDAPACP